MWKLPLRRKPTSTYTECLLRFALLPFSFPILPHSGKEVVAALLHEPLGGAGGPADAYGVDTTEPTKVYLGGLFDVVTVGIDPETLVEQHLTVTALTAAHEEYHVVAGGKGGDVGHAIGHLATDGVEGAECGTGQHVALDVGDDGAKLVERLGGLRVEVDVAPEVKADHVVHVLYHDGSAMSLAHQAQHLSVAALAKDNYLRVGIIGVLPLDAPLQLQHYRTSGIDDIDMIGLGGGVSGGRLAMGTQQHLDTV